MEISINITFKQKNFSQYLFNLVFYPVNLYDSNQRTLAYSQIVYEQEINYIITIWCNARIHCHVASKKFVEQ